MKDIVRFKEGWTGFGFEEVLFWRDVGAAEALNYGNLKKIFFNKRAAVVFNSEYLFEEDDLHFRRGGLDEQLLSKAKEKKIGIGFSFSDFINIRDARIRANVLGRMEQNVRLCRKYKLRMAVASLARNRWEMRHANDLLAFARTIGMTGKEAKEALDLPFL